MIEDVLDKAEERFYITDPLDEDSMLTELRYDFGFGYGICAIGVFDEENEFNCESLFPYFISESVSSIEQVSVEERIEGHTFAGVVDDLSVGTTLIFRLINSVEFLKYGAPQMKQIPNTSVCLSGLCISGTVMLPILKTEEEIEDSREQEMARRNLMNMARSGDEDAMKNLTMQDMDMYAVIMDKLQEDDIYTIVDSTFMPTGVECDLYSILGEIQRCVWTKNPITNEQVWILTIMCGDLLFKICINDQDLYGEPAAGRRFKGVVWMQGICHIVIEPDSAFFPLREAPETAERAVRLWCRELKADGLGLMFLDRSSLTPLVFVPGCDSVFWERSCASGTAAAGMYLASKTGREVDLALAEPGGILRVESSVRTGETRLYGSTRRMQTISE